MSKRETWLTLDFTLIGRGVILLGVEIMFRSPFHQISRLTIINKEKEIQSTANRGGSDELPGHLLRTRDIRS